MSWLPVSGFELPCFGLTPFDRLLPLFTKTETSVGKREEK
jgi:hypothetical protein